MTYNRDIPQPSDDPSDSQGQILINFQQLNDIFNFDHVTWNDATVANRGQHRQISIIDVIPDPNLLAPKCSVYTKLPEDSMMVPLTSNQLFFQNNNGASDVFQITGGGLAATTWVQFDGSGANGPVTTGQSLNISGVNKNSNGNYTISFSKNYHANDYCVLVMDNTNTTAPGRKLNVSTQNVGSVILSNTATFSPTNISVVIFGALE